MGISDPNHILKPAQDVIINFQEPINPGNVEERNEQMQKIEQMKAETLNGKEKLQMKLAHIYLQGKAVEPSHEKAFYCLNRAANLGFIEAQLELSSLYEHGNVIPQDLVSAPKWLLTRRQLAAFWR